MHIPFAMLVSLALALPMLAAPVVKDIQARDLALAAPSNQTIPAVVVRDEFALEARKAKAVKAKPKAVKKPVAKKVAPKKVAPKKVAPKPVAKKAPVKAPAKVAAKKAPVKAPAKVAAKKAPVKAPAKVAAKAPVKAPAKTTTVKKPAAKPPVKAPAKVAAKKAPVKAPAKTTAAKKPAAAAKKPTTVKKPTTAAKKPVAKPVAKKPTTTAKKAPVKAPAKTAPKAPAKSAVKPKATTAAAACPLKPAAKTTPATAAKAKAVKTVKKAKRAVDAFVRRVIIADRTLFGLIQPRLTGGNEFIGWHGTNEKTAALWESSGEIVRPTTVEGQTTGRSGLDAELGAGLYISDTLSVAEAAAAINAKNNNLKGKVCAIFAKSSANFRGAQDKVQVPEIIRGNAAVKEQERQSYITTLPGKIGKKPSLLLGPLGAGKNQMMIVESLNPNFEAQCFDVAGLDSVDAQAFEKAGNKVSYTSSTIISEWKIRKEDATIAKAVVAAIEKKCP